MSAASAPRAVDVAASNEARLGDAVTSGVVACARDDVSRQRYYVQAPSIGAAESPMLVVVHGLARDAEEMARGFASHCEARRVTLVAPLFSESFADYQRLGRQGRGPRADAALEAILEEVVMVTGAQAAPIYLFGHAAGAQFVHRYVMAYPHRVAGAAVANAGWYTFPKRRRRFPHGIRRSRSLPDVRFDPDEFLRVPITVLVGERDTERHTMRQSRRVQRQGATRLERGRNWVDAMRAAAAERQLAPLVSLDVLPGGAHSFADLMATCDVGARVMAVLFGEGGDRLRPA